MAYPQDVLAPHEKLVLTLHPHWWYIAKAGAALVVTAVVGSIAAAALGSGVLSTIVAIAVFAEVIWFVERFIRWVSTYFVLTSDRVMSREGILARHGIEIPLANINTVTFRQRIFERVLGLGNLTIESASSQGAQTFNTVRQPDEIQKQIYVQIEQLSDRGTERLRKALAGEAASGASAPGVALPAGLAPTAAPFAPGPPRAPGTPGGPGIGPIPPGPPAAAAPAPVAPAPTPPAATTADLIRDLAALRDQGLIDDAEFEARKQTLLNRM